MAARLQERVRTVLYMVAIASAFTAMVAAVNALTRKGIENNGRLREVRGVFGALGVVFDEGTTTEQIAAQAQQRLKPETRNGVRFSVGYDEKGDLVGYVFPIGGPGFWGPIRGYLALDSEFKRILGIRFVRHTETPGLGGRIAEEWFQKQFVGKPIVPPAQGGPAIRLVPQGKAKGPRDVDAITGATGTSRAVERFLNQNLDSIRKAMHSGGAE